MNPLSTLLAGFTMPALRREVSGWTKTGRHHFHLTAFLGRIVVTVEERRTHRLSVEGSKRPAAEWDDTRWRAATRRDLVEDDATAACIGNKIREIAGMAGLIEEKREAKEAAEKLTEA